MSAFGWEETLAITNLGVRFGHFSASDQSILSVWFLHRRRLDLLLGRQRTAHSGRLTVDNIVSDQLPLNCAVELNRYAVAFKTPN